MSYNIAKINRLMVGGVTLDPSNIISLDIFESINFPGITGKIAFRDYGSFKEFENIFAGDEIKISFGREQEANLHLEMIVTKSSGDTPIIDETSNITTLEFVSPWIVPAFTKKRSRPFRNKRIDEIVFELVKECGGTMGAFIRTKQKLDRFVSPYWTPIETIKYLMSFAVDENERGGFLLWTDIETKAVNFAPVSHLFDAVKNYGTVSFSIKMNPRDQTSTERIFEQSIEQSFDILKYGDVGLGRSRLEGFDYDNTKILSIDKRIDEYSHNHLSSKLPLNDKFLGKQFRTTKASFLYPNTDELLPFEDPNITATQTARSEGTTGASLRRTSRNRTQSKIKSNDLIKGRLANKQSLLISDIIKLNVKLNGETEEKRAGKQIKVIYPAADNSENLQYTGIYLIRNIRHVIQGMQFCQILTLIIDGFKEIDRIDMINFNGENNTFALEYDGDEFDADFSDSINTDDYEQTEQGVKKK